MDERRAAFRATALVDPGAVGWLRGQLGGRLTVGETAEDGRVVVQIGAQSAGAITWEIAGYGDRIEVLDPPEVREMLARIGADLVARYG
jgi:predicted DNA-binding transcriptional regulator YafY